MARGGLRKGAKPEAAAGAGGDVKERQQDRLDADQGEQMTL
jgi:hypothetical protein